MKDDPIDEFSRHEVLHMASVVADMFEQYVANHRYTQSDSELARSAEDVGTRLADFYQLVGLKTLSNEDPTLKG